MEPVNVLAVDDEYLIALDVQFMLANVPWCAVDVATTRELADKLTAPRFELVLIDPVSIMEETEVLIERIHNAGASVVLGTSDAVSADETAYPPRVAKPYSAEALLRTFVQALQPRHPDRARDVAEAISASGP